MGHILTSKDQTMKQKMKLLLVGMHLAKEIGAKIVEDLRDSLLAENYFNGFYEVQNRRMQK